MVHNSLFIEENIYIELVYAAILIIALAEGVHQVQVNLLKDVVVRLQVMFLGENVENQIEPLTEENEVVIGILVDSHHKVVIVSVN